MPGTNENDPYAAQWLRNLIIAGHIAPGDVDERSIVDVSPDDLAGYTQCHFFAGIGGWSYALRLAGWPDDRPVWTGSCPCQPFSAAGAGAAADDRRHLWPSWLPLIAERRPAIVFGEQVEAAIGWGCLDLVFADLENEGYACRATVLPACGVGAPHIRNRVWFVAHPGGWSFRRRDEYREHPGTTVTLSGEAPQQRLRADDGADSRVGELGFTASGGWQRLGSQPAYSEPRQADESAGPVVDAASEQVGFPGRARQPGSTNRIVEHADSARSPTRGETAAPDRHGSSLIAAGWDAIDWLPCVDGKARPVESGTFPLAHGIPGRVGRLRAYGNAIVPQVAAEFVGAVMDELGIVPVNTACALVKEIADGG